MKRILPLALIALLLAGCATSTVETRKKERYGAYSELSPEQRAAVDKGQIAIGMPMDAVYIAWGKPYQTVQSESPAGAFTFWLYYGSALRSVTYWGYPRPYYGGPYRYPYAYYGPTPVIDSVPVSYLRAEVTFEQGLVKQWRTLPAPGY